MIMGEKKVTQTTNQTNINILLFYFVFLVSTHQYNPLGRIFAATFILAHVHVCVHVRCWSCCLVISHISIHSNAKMHNTYSTYVDVRTYKCRAELLASVVPFRWIFLAAVFMPCPLFFRLCYDAVCVGCLNWKYNTIILLLLLLMLFVCVFSLLSFGLFKWPFTPSF